MHEIWLCKSILEIIQQKVREKKCARVKKVYLEMGALTAIDKSSLIFSFTVITQGTVAENAELEIINIPGEGLCNACQTNVPLNQYYDLCQLCGNAILTIIKGEELHVKSMEVE